MRHSILSGPPPDQDLAVNHPYHNGEYGLWPSYYQIHKTGNRIIGDPNQKCVVMILRFGSMAYIFDIEFEHKQLIKKFNSEINAIQSYK